MKKGQFILRSGCISPHYGWNQSSVTFNQYDLIQTGVHVILVLHSVTDLEGWVTALILCVSFPPHQRNLHGRFQFSLISFAKH